MKKLVLLVLINLIFISTYTQTIQKGNKNYSDQWLSDVQKEIEASEYYIKNIENTYQSPNRAQNLRIFYSKNGFIMEPRTEKDWEVGLNLRKIHKGSDALMANENAQFQRNNEKLFVKYSNYEIEYINNKEGMRQNFIVKNRPVGTEKLTAELSYTGTLDMVLNSENSIAFVTKSTDKITKNVKVWYKDLKVFDANGKTLSSKIEIKNNSIFIIVDDTDANYPVTIDPLSTSANWTFEPNQLNAFLSVGCGTAGDVNGDGYSDVIVGAYQYDESCSDCGKVWLFYGSSTGLSTTPNWAYKGTSNSYFVGRSCTTAGDVNNDGYSDVIIGASNYTNGQSGEGAAYIFHGSATGLASSPNRILESNMASANFGTSVSTAGDVNNDGYSDVLVGAPYYTNGQTSEGRAYLYLGSASGISASSSWTAESNQATAYFGKTVNAAGDLNGDGFSDIVVAAPNYDSTYADQGRIFVYYGQAASPYLAQKSGIYKLFEKPQASANYGSSAACAGDVNGDGYSDLVIGSLNYDNGSNDEGSAFIYYGGSLGANNTSDFTIEGNAVNTRIGTSVSSAGDVDGDGFGDVLIGAADYTGTYSNEGKAMVYFGSSSGLSLTNYWTASGGQVGSYFGYTVNPAGDVNGDGYSDVIIGAVNYMNGEDNEGKAFVYYGGANDLSDIENISKSIGQASYTNFGISVACAGDVDGNGYSDVIIGASKYDNGQTDEGAAFIYEGTSIGISTTYSSLIEANIASASFGYSVAGAGDVNNDGYSDVVIGSTAYTNGQSSEGRVYVFLGSSSGILPTISWSYESNLSTTFLGHMVSSAGDVNGDGYSDIIVSGHGYSNPEPWEGVVFGFYGSANGIDATTPDWTAEGGANSVYFGWSIACAGDVNNDGYSDVIVGAPYYDGGQTDEGKVYAFYGSRTGLPTTASWSLERDYVTSNLGYSVASAGDYNGDGYSDVIIAAPGYNDYGRVYIYRGSSSGISSTYAYVTHFQTTERFGESVSSAGDVNGDGLSDIIVGAPYYDGGLADEGAAFLYLSSGTSFTNVWSYESNQASAKLGKSVSSAGDVNGDGFSDVIIGVSDYDGTYSDEGKVFLFLGNEGVGLARRTYQSIQSGNAACGSSISLYHYYKNPIQYSNARIIAEKVNYTYSSPIINSLSYNDSSAWNTPTWLYIYPSTSVAGNYKWRVREEYEMSKMITGQRFSKWFYNGNGSSNHINGNYRVPIFPSITTQPTSSTICENTSSSFTVVATGDGLVYQWQTLNGTWKNVVNLGGYSGATTASLTISNALDSLNGRQYRCIIKGACSPSKDKTSSTVTLTINKAPAITGQPNITAVCETGNTSATVTATGYNLTYQWQVSINNGSTWSNISAAGSNPTYSGYNSATLSLTNVPLAASNYYYQCIVSGGCNPSPVTSSYTKLTVNKNIVIGTHPSNSSICTGMNTSFTANATGTNITYQWQVYNGSTWSSITTSGTNPSYSGYTSTTLSLTGVVIGNNNNRYRCIINGTCGTTNTNEATLTVNSAFSITGSGTDATVCSGLSTSFGIATTGTVTSYAWYYSNNSGSTWTQITSAGTSPAYSNWTTTTLGLTNIPYSANGYMYKCYVVGPCATATYSTARTLTVNKSTSITTQPSNYSVGNGGSINFYCGADGTNLTYQWQVDIDGAGASPFTNVTNGGKYSGALTSTLEIDGVDGTMNNYQYRCVVNSSTCTGAVNSSAGILTVTSAPAITVHPAVSRSICNGANTMIYVTATGTITGYRWKVSTDNGSTWNKLTNTATYSGTTNDSITITNAGTGLSGYKYLCTVYGSGNDSALSNNLTLTVNTGPTVSTQPSNQTKCAGQDAIYSITATNATGYQWEFYNGTSWADISGANSSSVTRTGVTTGMNNFQYRCKVTGTCTPSATSNSATLTVNSAPTVTNPTAATICAGQSTSFTVTGTGAGITYQWYKSSDKGVSYSSIVSGTAATLNLSNVPSTEDSTKYLCVVTGTCSPNDTSNSVYLKVNTKPTVTTDPITQTKCVGSAITLTVAASGTTPYTYQWKKGTSNVGTNSNTISFASIATGDAGTYSCIVTNSCGSDSSNNAIITVNVPPSISSQPTLLTRCVGASATFNITATGTTPLNYQWKHISTNIGTNSNSYTNSSVAVPDSGNYSCVVTNVCGTTTSNNAKLTINTAPSVISNPSDQTICQSTNTKFKVKAIGTAVNYQWERSTNGGSSFGTLAGENKDSLTISSATTGMNGYKYRCIITGTCTPTATSDTGTLYVNSAPLITSQPVNAAICEGHDTAFGVSASGHEISYAWEFSSNSGSTWNPIAGAISNRLSLTGVTNSMNTYYYRAIVSGSCLPAATSTSRILTVYPLPIVNLGNDTSICFGSSVQLDAGAGFTNYAWNTTATTRTITVSTANDYVVLVTNSNGCKNLSTTKKVKIKYPVRDSICIVTIDPETEKNMIVWHRKANKGIAEYRIYRETAVANNYALIGIQPFDSVSRFVDLTSLPRNQQHLYKITSVDTCGNESSLDSVPYHKTMLLQYAGSSGGINLSWLLNYRVDNIDYPFMSYVIYRSADSLTNFVPIATISGSLNGYIDTDPQSALNRRFYRVAGVMAGSCSPLTLKASSGPFSQSVSNLEDNRLKAVDANDVFAGKAKFIVFPNPYHESTTIAYNLKTTATISIEVYNVLGQKIAMLVNNQTQDKGEYSVKFNGKEYGCKAGYYTVKFIVNGKEKIEKIINIE